MSDNRPPPELLASIRDVKTESLSDGEALAAWAVHQAVTELSRASGREPPPDPLRSVLWAATQWIGELQEARKRGRDEGKPH